MRLKDKIALFTGSSHGIGRAIAVRFTQEGADVVINYNRTAKGAEEVLAEVEAYGRRGLIVQADLGKVYLNWHSDNCGTRWRDWRRE